MIAIIANIAAIESTAGTDLSILHFSWGIANERHGLVGEYEAYLLC